jgi:hypothetical protein
VYPAGLWLAVATEPIRSSKCGLGTTAGIETRDVTALAIESRPYVTIPANAYVGWRSTIWRARSPAWWSSGRRDQWRQGQLLKEKLALAELDAMSDTVTR